MHTPFCMSKSRILILAAASFAFLLMLTTVTASNDFLYAPESTWRTSSDAAQDIAVAAWRSQTRTSAAAATTSSAQTDPSSEPAASSTAASSTPAVSSDPAPSTSSASSVDDDLPDWVPDWWNRDDDGGRGGRDKDKGRKGRH